MCDRSMASCDPNRNSTRALLGIGAGFEHVHSGWRYMVGLGAIPAAIQLVFLFFLPESRQYLHSLISLVWFTLLFRSEVLTILIYPSGSIYSADPC